MKIVLAPDSFKECISAHDACDCMASGIKEALPCDIIAIPMADGGEGTGQLLAHEHGLRRVAVTVCDPLRRPLVAGFHLSADGETAVVETAEANGLGLLAAAERNPETVDTFGCGQLIRAALEAASRTVFVAIGGSATVDGGKGVAEALGYKFLDASCNPLPPGAGSLRQLARIEPPSRPSSGPDVVVLCDVTNPLLGPRGAAPVFAPQKGADAPMVTRLETGLIRLAERIRLDLGIEVTTLAGGGAAGGLGAGLVAFADATLEPGADRVAEQLGLETALDGADLVITGEGRVDEQSFDGKVLSTVARLARQHGVPLAIIGGEVTCESNQLKAAGAISWHQLMRVGESPSEAMNHVRERLTRAATTVCRLLKEADVPRRAET